MIRKWLKIITEVGVSDQLTSAKKMSVTLSNYISIILILITSSLWVSSSSQNKINIDHIVALGLILFILPFLFNYLKLFRFNRIYLSWAPPLYVLSNIFYWADYFDGALTTSNYIGVRFYFIALGCIPFIIFNSKDLFWIFVGALPTFAILLLFNDLLDFYKIEYFTSSTTYTHFSNTVRRSLLSYSFVAGSCYLLKYLIDKYNNENQQLIEQLDAQNLFIQQQAEAKLTEANYQLKLKVDELSKRAQMLKLSQQIAKVGSWEFGADKKFTFWSEEMFNIFDLEIDTNLEDIDYKSLVGNDKWQGFYEVSKELIVKKGEFALVINITTPLGYSKWIKVYAFATVKDDQIIGVRGICHDITQARESELLLKASENKYRGLFEQSFYPILLINPKGIILDANNSLSLLTKINKDEFLLKNINTLITFSEGKKIDFSRSSYTEETLGEIQANTGEKLLVEINWKIMPSDRVIVTLRDVTQIKAAQKHLIESEERYKELVENATEALVVINWHTGKFVNASNSAEVLFKIPKDKLLELGPLDISPEFQPNGSESKEILNQLTQQALKNGKESFTWTCKDAEGSSIPCEIRLVKIPSRKEKLLRGSIIDISDKIEKAKELEIANKKIGELKLIALRSVMSPHFIFNALNSIQYFIGKNERLNAINYLSTFSKLIRSILTHSVDNKIKLSEEVEMLKNYISLEMLRFEDKFNFNLIIDPDLEIDYIEIPSLLIQPYVENAILHGLYNKAEKGTLTIEITEKGDVIYFTIEDDGIGRDASMLLNAKSFPKHKSLGLKLTQERLELINENRNVSFYIEDLEKGGEPIGTRVTIGILS